MIARILLLPLHALQGCLRRRYTRRARALQLEADAARAHGMEAYARTLQDQATRQFVELVEEQAKCRAAELRAADLEKKLSEAGILRALAKMELESAQEELASLRARLELPTKKRQWS